MNNFPNSDHIINPGDLCFTASPLLSNQITCKAVMLYKKGDRKRYNGKLYEFDRDCWLTDTLLPYKHGSKRFKFGSEPYYIIDAKYLFKLSPPKNKEERKAEYQGNFTVDK